MSDPKVNIGGTWKTVNGVAVNIGGTWKNVCRAQVNIGGTWKDAFSLVQATGGTVTTDGDYKIHTFTGNGTFSVSNPGMLANLFILGGGGGGGIGCASSLAGGGGGGGGGYRSLTSIAVTAQSYSITVGSGGSRGTCVGSVPTQGANGNNSTALGYTAYGGGGGASSYGLNNATYYPYRIGKDGGSGGGGAWYTYMEMNGAGGDGSQGGDGNQSIGNAVNVFENHTLQCGCGGGAGGKGTIVAMQRQTVGPGVSFLGVTYGIGGGGYENYVAGGSNLGPTTTGVANRGHGGNGGSYTASGGSAGSSGIVIIRYKYK